MKAFAVLARALNQDNDALAEHRHDIVKHLCFIAGLMLLVAALTQVVQQAWPQVALNCAVSALLLLTAATMWRGGKPALPLSLLGVVLVISSLASVYIQGMTGVLWSYPLLFVCYFALPRRQATVLCLLLLVGVFVIGLSVIGVPQTVRILLSQVFVVLMINVVLSVIGELQRALVAQTITDPLTGAFNRRHMQTHVERLAQPGPNGPRPMDIALGHALLALDIDHFKRINDLHGHDIGDEVLRRLVDLLQSSLRNGDLVFRTGGEEFMLLLPRIGQHAALSVAEAIRQQVASSPLLPGEAGEPGKLGQTVTVSIGVSVLSPGQGTRQWLKSADTALYEAKNAGRDRVALAA